MTDIDFHPTSSATRDLPPVVVPVLMRELGLAQQGRYPSVAVAAVLTCQLNHFRDQALFVVTVPSDIDRAVLPEPPAGATLRDPEPVPDVIDTLLPALGAQQFPRAASAKICVSSVKSETVRRRRS